MFKKDRWGEDCVHGEKIEGYFRGRFSRSVQDPQNITRSNILAYGRD